MLQQGSSAAHIALTIIAIGLVITLLGLGTGIIRAIFRDWDYRLTRETRVLRRTRGLTTRTDVAITIRRIQSATIISGLIRQMFGWHEVRLRSLASDIGSGAGGGDHQALPFAQMADVDRLLSEIHLQPDWPALQWHRSHPILALPSLLLGALLMAAGLLAAHFLSPLGWLTVSGGFLIGLLGFLSARRHFYAADGAHILIRSGLMRPATTIIPHTSIQSADIRDNFVYRRLGLASLAFGVPGISSIADDHVPAIPLSDAIRLRADILHQD